MVTQFGNEITWYEIVMYPGWGSKQSESQKLCKFSLPYLFEKFTAKYKEEANLTILLVSREFVPFPGWTNSMNNNIPLP